MATIWQRKLVQWALAYAASAAAVLQVLDLLANRFAWPAALVRSASIILAFGLAITLVLAWYHGEQGHQRVRGSEIILLLIIVVCAGGSVALYSRSPSAPAPRAAPSSVPKGSIAVLPFLDMSSTRDQEYFVDGLTEELLNSLAQVQGLRVVARTSSFAFKGKEVPLDSIAKQLNVSHLLEGSIRKEGDKVRITAKLVDSQTGFELWSQNYDRQVRDVFAVEEEIARAIASALQMRLTGQALVAGGANAAAHELYLRGRFAFNKQTLPSLQEAIEYYQKALTAQPDYALAHAAIGEALIWLADSFLAPRDAYPRAKAEALKALAIDSTLAEARALLGQVETLYDWDGPRGLADGQRAVELAPNSAMSAAYLGAWYTIFGSINAAVVRMQHARDMDPLNPVLNGILAATKYWARDYDGALRAFAFTEQLDPNYVWLGATHGDVYREKKMYDKAVATYRHEQELTGVPSAGLGVVYARTGRRNDALKVAHDLEAFATDHYVAVDRIAVIYANLGDLDHAFDLLLGTGMKQRDTWMAWIPVMPEFDVIRDDPRYPKLLRMMNLEDRRSPPRPTL